MILGKVVQHPKTWVDGDGEGREEMMIMAALFCFNRCCPICLCFELFISEALVIFSFHILWKYQQHSPFLVAPFLLVFFVSPFILSIFVIWNNTVTLCCLLECLLKYIKFTILHQIPIEVH